MQRPIFDYDQPHLLPAFAPCPTCGQLVQVRTWHMAAHGLAGFWAAYPEAPRSPVTGLPHQCPATEEAPHA